MNLFHISDLHLYPNDYNYMNKKFGKNSNFDYLLQEKWKELWSENISNDDIVFLTGDTIWGHSFNHAMVVLNDIEELPGKKIIIPGNHDSKWWSSSNIRHNYNTIIPVDDCWYKYFNLMIIGSKGLSKHEKYKSKTNYYKILSYRLKCVSSIFTYNNLIKILLLHYPPETKRMENLIRSYNIDFVLYGHQHNSPNIKYNIGNTVLFRNMIENTGFKPVKLNILKWKESNKSFRKYKFSNMGIEI